MNDIDLNNIAAGIEQQQPAPTEQPLVQSPPVEVAKPIITISDIQTADKTLMGENLPNKSSLKEVFDPATTPDFFKTFIGLNKNNYNKLNDVVTDWALYRSAVAYMSMSDKEREKADISISECQAAITKWTEYCEIHYPGVDMEVLNVRFLSIYGFIQNIFDPVLAQFPILQEKDVGNVSQFTTKLQRTDVNAMIPGRNKDDTKFSLSEFMSRTSLNSTGEAYQYDILLRNSYVALTYKRSSKLELADLINNIAKAVTGHVRHLQQNVPALSNIAVIRVIWNHIRDRILRVSMKDVNDFNELADVIRINDIQPIAAGLLANAYPRGVNFQLQCLGDDGCDWTDTKVVDPTVFVRFRKHLDTLEESAAYANMLNFSRKYSREESRAFQKTTNYGRDLPPVYNRVKNSWFVIAVPTLTEAFEAEEYFAEYVKNRLNEIQQTSITQEQFIERRDELLNGLVGTDYLHYVSEYHTTSDTDSEANVIVIKRNEVKPEEFNQGLINIILENQEMGANLINAVITNYPYLSKTFVGMANYECPKCAGKASSMEELGYTPINIINAFFTLTSQTFTGRARAGENALEEALTNILG